MSGGRMRVRRRYFGVHAKSHALPANKPAPDTTYDELVTLILKEAQRLAQDVEPGDEVGVNANKLIGDLPADLRAVISRVMYNAGRYDLLPGTSELTFYFIKGAEAPTE